MAEPKMTQLVMTLLGRDRPGLVESVASTVRDQGGNWLESRMARLADHFAGILRAEVPAGHVDALQKALATLPDLSVQINFVESSAENPRADPVRAWLEVTGYDRPGIVHEITEVLAAQRINIEQLESDLHIAAMSGDHTFHARAQLVLGSEFDLDALQTLLERIGADLQVDVALETVE